MTTQKHYYLFTDGIGVFKTEKPTDEKGNFISRSYFKQALNDWLQSGEKYQFGEGEEEKFIDFCRDNVSIWCDSMDCTIKSKMESGILIPSERVDFDGEFEQPSGRWKRKYAKFVPIEEDKPKEETPEFGIRTFRNVQMAAKVELQLKPKYMNDVFTWKQILDAIMYDELTRK